jgi:hypothetical protein
MVTEGTWAIGTCPAGPQQDITGLVGPSGQHAIGEALSQRGEVTTTSAAMIRARSQRRRAMTSFSPRAVPALHRAITGSAFGLAPGSRNSCVAPSCKTRGLRRDMIPLQPFGTPPKMAKPTVSQTV